MTLTLNLADDMAVFDGTETVTLTQPGGSSVSVENCMRKLLSSQRIRISDVGILEDDIEFNLPTIDIDIPELGAVIAATDKDWIVLDSKLERLDIRYTCIVRDRSLIKLLDIYRATQEKAASGATDRSWSKKFSALLGHLILVRRIPESDDRGHGEIKQYRIYLVQPAAIFVEDQVRSRGIAYKITSVDKLNSAGLAVIVTAEVTRWP